MKTPIKNLSRILLSFCLVVGIFPAWAEDADDPAAREDVAPEALLTEEELDKLTGPIALYPDALVALILPASTELADVVMAARYFVEGGKADDVDSQPWDESVRALGRYPEVIQWLDENLAWTRQLGAAFLAQPSEVMQAIQRMRARARDAGNLTSTQEQTVIVEPDYIRIVPTQSEVLYVPRYNPEIVYVPVTTYYGPVIAYGAPYPCGSWLRYDCNWWSWSIWMGSWSFAYYHQPAWRPPPGPRPPPPRYGHGRPPHDNHTWRPSPGKRPPHVYPPRHGERRAERPVPMHGAPGRAAHFVRPGIRSGDWNGGPRIGNPGERRPDGRQPAVRPRLGEDGNRPRPGNQRNDTPPAGQVSPPSPRGGASRPDARPEAREGGRGRPGTGTREWNGRGRGEITPRSPAPGLTPPSTPPRPPSAAPAPGARERDQRDSLSPDVRRRTFRLGEGTAPAPREREALASPNRGPRPGIGDTGTRGREARPRREAPPALSSPAPSYQRPPSASLPSRQATRPPPPRPPPPPPSPQLKNEDPRQQAGGPPAQRDSGSGRDRGRRQ